MASEDTCKQFSTRFRAPQKCCMVLLKWMVHVKWYPGDISDFNAKENMDVADCKDRGG